MYIFRENGPFTMINCEDVLENLPITNFKCFLLYAKDKLVTEHALKCRQEVLNKPKLILYKLFKENFQTEKYC